MEKEPTKIEGVVDTVIYRSEESGYAVARVRLQDGAETVAVGVMPFLGAGERIAALGEYTTHPQHGEQFSVWSYEREMPASLTGIYDYLASGVVKGIGLKTARAIVDRFGSDSFDILATAPEKLTVLRGITRARAEQMSASFVRLNAMRLLVQFLASNALPAHFSAGLLSLFGERAVDMLGRDPYLLCGERFGLDFEEADKLAQQYGIRPDSDVRLDAALVYELLFNAQKGHSFVPEDKLVQATRDLCGADETALYIRAERLCELGRIVVERIRDRRVCYLPHLHRCETLVAAEIDRLCGVRLTCPPHLEKMIRREEQANGIRYADRQKEAMRLCFHSAISLITGGPGTGKTTALLTMIALIEQNGLSVLLAAPTGRAAKRISELTGREAKTLHRLLEATFSEDGVIRMMRNRDNPLNADVVIVDEASMIDVTLAASLVEALKPHTRLVFVGDADQLPPVGPGNFFADLLSCERVPSVRLTDIFRQAQDSRIVTGAHRINSGRMPELTNGGDLFFMNTRSADNTVRAVASLVAERIPSRFGIPSDEVQVICPSRQMACGTTALNRTLQQVLNPQAQTRAELRFGSAVFRAGDRVMQIRNNYDLLWRREHTHEVGMGVYNGDVGTILAIDRAARVLHVRFDDRVTEYSFDQCGEIEHAFAITVHKSQGSEYDAVVIPVFSAPERLLTRKLLYTAVTRARRLLVLVGREEMVAKMVESNAKNTRYGALRLRLRGEVG